MSVNTQHYIFPEWWLLSHIMGDSPCCRGSIPSSPQCPSRDPGAKETWWFLFCEARLSEAPFTLIRIQVKCWPWNSLDPQVGARMVKMTPWESVDTACALAVRSPGKQAPVPLSRAHECGLSYVSIHGLYTVMHYTAVPSVGTQPFAQRQEKLWKLYLMLFFFHHSFSACHIFICYLSLL